MLSLLKLEVLILYKRLGVHAPRSHDRTVCALENASGP